MVPTYSREKINTTAVLIVLSTLFFMWGLITVLNFMLVDELKTVFAMNQAQALLVSFVFFGTYFVAAIPAGRIIHKYGYKNGIMAGIVVAGFGCMMFYPAAAQRKYELFVLSSFIVASGITMLQVGANTYVVLLGRKERNASRLTLVQGFNALGAFLAPYLASGVFMKIAGLTEESRLSMSPEEFVEATIKYVQLPYLGLGAVLFLLALFVGFSRLPKLNTAYADPLARTPDSSAQKYIFQFPHLILGALAIFCYVGAEVTIGQYLGNRAEHLVPIFWGAALAGRFLGSAMLTVVGPRKLIAVNAGIAAILIGVFIVLANIEGASEKALYVLAATGLFNSILFPCIFTLGIDGLGRFTEEGASVLILSIVGGAIIPMVWANLFDASLGAAFVLVIFCYLYVSYFGAKGSKYEKRTNFY